MNPHVHGRVSVDGVDYEQSNGNRRFFLPLFTTKVSVSLTLKRKGELVTRILSKTDNTSNKKKKKNNKKSNHFFLKRKKKETKKESYIVMCKSTYRDIYIYIYLNIYI